MHLKHGSMVLTVERVTPAIAERWLSQSNTNNRHLRKKIVSQYADDMRRGEWHFKPVAICFGDDGSIVNGQHSLSAVVESGCSQDFLIARNVPASAVAVMDVGLRRTIKDIGHFLGESLGSRQAAIAKVIALGPVSNDPRSFSFLLDVYLRHQEAIDTLCSLAPKMSGFSAPVMAVMVRAWETRKHDRGRISTFIEIVKTGVVEGPEDVSAIRLRDYCRSMKSSGGSREAVETYRRAQSSLDAFLRRKPMSKLYGTDRELFPLPDDKQ